MIISVHIPKTAGTSFSLSLNQRFGRAYRSDYMDRLFTTETSLDRKSKSMAKALEMRPEEFEGIQCVHGHFLAFKYRFLAEQMPCSFITWLRDPIDRLLSHYYYWVEAYDPAYAQGHHKRFMEEGWTLEKFCLADEFRNIQSQFLWSTPMSSFDFVGITEHYAEDFSRFSKRFLGSQPETFRVNATKTKPSKLALDQGLRKEIEAFHSQDVALYEAALARREREIHGDPVVAARFRSGSIS